jgi:hypothetical protein
VKLDFGRRLHFLGRPQDSVVFVNLISIAENPRIEDILAPAQTVAIECEQSRSDIPAEKKYANFALFGTQTCHGANGHSVSGLANQGIIHKVFEGLDCSITETIKIFSSSVGDGETAFENG